MRLLALSLAALGAATAAASSSVADVCKEIELKSSRQSDVIYALPNLLAFPAAINHWMGTSTQTPACVFRAGAVEDVSTALKIIAKNKTPFAVYSGGHAAQPTFSSTTGVHIMFGKMKQVVLSDDLKSVEIGMGQTWADVYKVIEPKGVMVTGGRTAGPGVGGFTLGGGYSWKTNQFGLTSDTVLSFTAVLPNGTIAKVDKSTPDLFFALRGGLNRFGIVTSAVYATHPQVPQVFAGIRTYSSSQLSTVLNATSTFFRDNKDPKAQVITTLEGETPFVLFFYDGPSSPPSFQPFDGIKPTLDLVKTQRFSEFVGGLQSHIAEVINPRGTFHTLSTSKLTPGFLEAVKNETAFWGAKKQGHGGITVSYDIEPFLEDYGQHDAGGCFPHATSPLPLNLYWSWDGARNDAFWYGAMRASVDNLKRVALAEGIYPSEFTAYSNYAIRGTTSEALYGKANAQRLRQIKKQVDPQGVMDLAGGFDLN